MWVVCPDCNKRYDDVYRRTFCPHDRFEMLTVAMRADGTRQICRTVEELHSFLQGDA